MLGFGGCAAEGLLMVVFAMGLLQDLLQGAQDIWVSAVLRERLALADQKYTKAVEDLDACQRRSPSLSKRTGHSGRKSAARDYQGRARRRYEPRTR